MPRILDTNQLRKELGIKKLRKKIPISDFEIAAINRLREDEKERVLKAQKERIKA
jgi:alpha-ketoglutarate-dependent taurine dioxygenase